GYPEALTLSEDGNYLYVSYLGPELVQVFNVHEMLDLIAKVKTPGPLPVGDITALDPKLIAQIQADASANGQPRSSTPLSWTPIDDYDEQRGPLIDVQADFRPILVELNDDKGNPLFNPDGTRQKRWAFGVPPGDPNNGGVNPRAPIAAGYVTGLAVQFD